MDLAFPLSSTVQSPCNVQLSSCKNREINCMEKSNEMSWWHMFISCMLCPVITCFQTFESAAGIPERHYRLLFLLIHFFVRCSGGFLACTGCTIPRISEKVNNFLWMHACFFTWLCIRQPIVLQTKGQYRKRNWNCSSHKDTKQNCTSFDIRHT